MYNATLTLNIRKRKFPNPDAAFLVSISTLSRPGLKRLHPVALKLSLRDNSSPRSRQPVQGVAPDDLTAYHEENTQNGKGPSSKLTSFPFEQCLAKLSLTLSILDVSRTSTSVLDIVKSDQSNNTSSLSRSM